MCGKANSPPSSWTIAAKSKNSPTANSQAGTHAWSLQECILGYFGLKVGSFNITGLRGDHLQQCAVKMIDGTIILAEGLLIALLLNADIILRTQEGCVSPSGRARHGKTAAQRALRRTHPVPSQARGLGIGASASECV